MTFPPRPLLVNSDGEYDSCGFPSSNNCRSADKKRASAIELNYEQLDGSLLHKLKFFDTRHKRRNYVNGVASIPNVGKKSKIEYQAVMNWAAADTDQTTILALNKEKNEAIGQYIAGGRGGQFDTKSLVLEQRVDFGNDVYASISGRYDDNQNDRFKDYKTYRGTLAWVVNDDLRLHTSAGTGVKNPQVSELYGWSSDWVANPDLLPETSKSWDFGVEFHPGLADLTVDLTYFNNEVTNLIGNACGANCDNLKIDGTPDTSDDISKSVNNPGVSTIKGWELSAFGRIADTYDVTASATFLKGFDSNNKELIRRPSQILTLNFSREFTNSGKLGTINMNLQHIGNQLDYTSWPNVGDLPEYTLVNLAATLNLNSNLELNRVRSITCSTRITVKYAVTTSPAKRYWLGLRYSLLKVS